MQAITLDLSKEEDRSINNGKGLDVQFSLKPFIDFITRKVDTEKTAKVNFYKYILDQFHRYPELDEPILLEDAGKYTSIYELIYTALSPIINDENEQLWALSKPLSPLFYFGTNAFYNVLMDPETCGLKQGLKMPSAEEMKESALLNFYDLILKKFYNISLRTGLFTIKSIVDPETHLLKYYRLNVDSRFLEITSTSVLPKLSLESVKDYIQDEHTSLSILTNLLPPEQFVIRGVSVITLIDVTPEYALEAVKNVIIEHNECNTGCHSDHISIALKTLVGSNEIEFGLLPYVQLNGKMIMHEQSGFESIVIQLAKKEHINHVKLLEDYIKNPRRLIFPEITDGEQLQYPILRMLWRHEIRSYALLPLNYNGKLVGCLEVYSKNPRAFNEHALSNIDLSMPLLSQLFQNIITEFNYDIISVITDKFTSLQPSVQWRFFEAAYNYISSGSRDQNLPVEPIYFKNVLPMYGAVDIKNSSIERNLVIRKDLYKHFEILEHTLVGIKDNVSIDVQDEIPAHSAIWGYKEFEELSDREILKIEDYLLRQLPPYLTILRNSHPELEQLIDAYFAATGENAEIYTFRNQYEESMQKINRVVTSHLEAFNASLQQIYPSYFEKFRTDGVEFDIYLGQSIAPEIPMQEDVIAIYRCKQLQLLANIARTTYSLIPTLALPLETTQLIFVYEKLIDISFRTDEQRFDVEGSYNIRYQMVKKRIDKAHLKNSHERLTQTGKIAIVYFNNWEAQEYMGYIKTLQQEGLLEEEVEFLEIEELQGVESLKALRVKVKMAVN